MNFFRRKRPTPSQQPSQLREWFHLIISTVIILSLFRSLVFEPFVIPSSSMEKTLLTGDYILVSKLHYGARTPKTPLKIPLTHQTIGRTGIPCYLDWVQLPQYRLPHFSQVSRGDIAVFNYPMELDKPIDIRLYYIKRCVALPGDELQIKDAQIYVNDDPLPQYSGLQYRYYLKTSAKLPPHFFNKHDIRDYRFETEGYSICTTPATAAQLAQVPSITDVKPIVWPAGMANSDVYFSNLTAPWNEDQFGPIKVPAKGNTIPINEQTLAQYERVITYHEGHRDVKIENDQLWINGQQLASYTFQQDYYFMMGDNRHGSSDSRFFGFVPQDHLVGKAVFVVFSLDQQQKWPKKIRWKRLFRPIW